MEGIYVVALVALAMGAAAQWMRLAERRREVALLIERQREQEAAIQERQAQIERLNAEVREGAAQVALISPLQARVDELQGECAAQRASREHAQQENIALRARLEAEHARLSEQRQAFDEAKQNLVNTFRAVGSQALEQNNQQFLVLAEQAFKKQAEVQHHKNVAQQQSFGELIKPIRDALDEQKVAVTRLSHQQAEAYGELKQKTEQLASANGQLSMATQKLHHSLSRTDIRGRWGEVNLQNVIEFSGMTPHVDFETQACVQLDGAVQRPDLVVRLPGRGCIVVDAKVPLKHYLEAHDTDDEQVADESLSAHARALRAHVNALADKAYWKAFEHTPELVVLYVPLESALSIALRKDASLHSDALERRVLIATPTTLMALLSTIAHGFRREALADNARKIAEVGQQLGERIETFVGHFSKLGKALEGATKEYNKATGSLESRVLTSARRMSELGARSTEELEAPSEIETHVRVPRYAPSNDDSREVAE